MESIGLADAKMQLSSVIDRVEAGETISITRRGREVARIIPVPPERLPFDWDSLRRHVASMPFQEESAGDFMRRIRDEEY